MNAKEKFDKMMNLIEDEIENGFSKDAVIVERLTKELVVSLTMLNAVFPFLTDMTLRQYIRERRMMLAYNAIISLESWEDGISEAMCISQANDQAYFSNQFKELFKITPRTAFQNKDKSLYKGPLNWDMLSMKQTRVVIKRKKEVSEQIKFGINEKKLNLAIEAAGYQKFYGLSDKISEEAYKLMQKGIKAKYAFEFIDEISIIKPSLLIDFKSDSYNDLIYMYFNVFNCVKSVFQVMDFIYELHCNGTNDIRKYSPWFYNLYFDTQSFPQMTWKDYLKYYELYTEQRKKLSDKSMSADFSGFLNLLSDGVTPEEAIIDESVTVLEIANSLDMEREMKINEAEIDFEKWADEQTFYDRDEDIYDPYNEDDET